VFADVSHYHKVAHLSERRGDDVREHVRHSDQQDAHEPQSPRPKPSVRWTWPARVSHSDWLMVRETIRIIPVGGNATASSIDAALGSEHPSSAPRQSGFRSGSRARSAPGRKFAARPPARYACQLGNQVRRRHR
jgi:hypothetical protein